MRPRHPECGFSILEALAAATIAATALVALSHLLILAARAGHAARAQSSAVILAIDKLEELQSDLSIFGGTTAGRDRVDAAGRQPADPLRVPFSPVYVRQWSALPLAADASLLLLEVVVVPSTTLGAVDADVRDPGAVALASVVAGRAP